MAFKNMACTLHLQCGFKTCFAVVGTFIDRPQHPGTSKTTSTGTGITNGPSMSKDKGPGIGFLSVLTTVIIMSQTIKPLIIVEVAALLETFSVKFFDITSV